MVKIAVLPPIPSASVKMAAMANPGFLRSMRAPKRRSCRNECIRPPIIGRGLAAKVISLVVSLLFLTEDAELGRLNYIAGSRMNVIAYEHHQSIAGTQGMCAEQAVFAA